MGPEQRSGQVSTTGTGLHTKHWSAHRVSTVECRVSRVECALKRKKDEGLEKYVQNWENQGQTIADLPSLSLVQNNP